MLDDPHLTPAEKVFLIALSFDDWRKPSKRYYPSNADLAQATNLTPRQIRNIIASLRAKGRIVIEPHPNPTHRVIHRIAIPGQEIPIDEESTLNPLGLPSKKKPKPFEQEKDPTPAPPSTPTFTPSDFEPYIPTALPPRPSRKAQVEAEPSPVLLTNMARMSRIAKRLVNNDGKAIGSNAQDMTVEERDRLASGSGDIHQETPTPGQADFLASLNERRRAKFLSMSPAKQREILVPHAVEFQPDLLVVQGIELDKPIHRQIPPLPDTVEGLLLGLPGSPFDWPPKAAAALSQAFGTTRDNDLWLKFHGITTAVASGWFPADALLDAYRQATSPETQNRVDVFKVTIRRHGWTRSL